MLKIDLLNFEDARYERKFVISEIEAREIELLIKNHPAMFFEIFYQRQVNNIYFDLLDMKHYYEHVDGGSQRLKVRVRWYGDMFGVIKKPVLEIKVKKNHFVKKISFPLRSFRLNKKFSMKDLYELIFSKSDLPAEIFEALRLFKPTLLNSYKRKYFLSSNKKYRFTVDTNLKFYKIKPLNNLFFEKIIDDGVKILELKYGQDAEKNASSITEHLPFRLSQSSKYISGVDLLGL